MASIQRRGESWRAGVSRNGQRAAGTFDTKAEAADWAVRTEAAMLAGAFQARQVRRPSSTAAEMFERYATDISPTKGGGEWEVHRLRAFGRHELFRGPVEAVNGAAMAEWRDARLLAVAASTVNRELNLMSAVWNIGIKEWRVPGLTLNPVRMIMRPKNPRPRTQRVSDADRAAILAALEWDGQVQPLETLQWIAFAFSLALETAMRRGEIQAVRWRDVSLEARCITLHRTKNGEMRRVPLSSRAIALLQLVHRGDPHEMLIPIPYGTAGTLYRRATRKAGLGHIRFHDARREATTVFSKRLSNVLELSAVTGHKSLQVLKGYYAPAVADLADKLG